MEPIIFYRGEIITKEGDPSDCIYILKTGVVGVYKNHVCIGHVSKPGAIFGEVSRILGERHSATTIAEAECSVIPVTLSIEEIILRHPKVAKEIMVQLADRLSRMNEIQSFGESMR